LRPSAWPGTPPPYRVAVCLPMKQTAPRWLLRRPRPVLQRAADRNHARLLQRGDHDNHDSSIPAAHADTLDRGPNPCLGGRFLGSHGRLALGQLGSCRGPAELLVGKHSEGLAAGIARPAGRRQPFPFAAPHRSHWRAARPAAPAGQAFPGRHATGQGAVPGPGWPPAWHQPPSCLGPAEANGRSAGASALFAEQRGRADSFHRSRRIGVRRPIAPWPPSPRGWVGRYGGTPVPPPAPLFLFQECGPHPARNKLGDFPCNGASSAPSWRLA
jgi:hypothetical protein